MIENEIDDVIVAENPETIPGEQTFVYLPKGIRPITFDEDQFVDNNNHISLNTEYIDDRTEDVAETVVDNELNTRGIVPVSVSTTGTSTSEVFYITVNGVQYKLAGGGGGSAEVDDYSSSKSYERGDLFIYNNTLGVTTVDHTAEEYNDNHNILLGTYNTVNGKLDKATVTSGISAYVVSGSSQMLIPVAVNATANAIARFDGNGKLRTTAPTLSSHVTTKQYVDDANALLAEGIDAVSEDVDVLELDVDALEDRADTTESKIPNNASSSNKLTTADDLQSAISGVVTNFVVSTVDEPDFDSDNATITISGSFTDINDNVIPVSSLKVGANIYVTELNVFDRWVGSINLTVTPNTATLYKLTTEKVPVTDVQKPDGTSLVSGGVAKVPIVGAKLGGASGTQATVDTNGNIIVPIADTNVPGLVGVNSVQGIWKDSSGNLYINTASLSQIANRSGARFPITAETVNPAVTAALTDANHITLDNTQKETARGVFGAITVDDIPDASTNTKGIAKVNPAYGITNNTVFGFMINNATDEQIRSKAGEAIYRPITAGIIDKAIKEGLGNYDLTKTGAEWSDAYKAHAREVIGASNINFVDWTVD